MPENDKMESDQAQAIRYLQKALYIEKDHYRCLYSMGMIFKQQKKYQEARQTFNRVTEIHPY